jgi:flotillin
VDVAEQDKLGSIGEAEAVREREIKVAENLAQAEKGKKAAEADRRVFVQQQETTATVGEAVANREKTIQVAANVAESEKGKKKAEADQRIYVQARESEAIGGENTAKATIAESNATLLVKQAEAFQRGEVAKRHAQVQIQIAQAEAETERLKADEVVRQEIDKQKVEIAAEAEAEKRRREAKGAADATLLRYEAEAKGLRQVLDNKAAGYAALVQSCGGDAKAAATLLMVEKIEEIVKMQVEAIRNIKIDKVTVWDGGASGENGGGSTANFMKSLIHALPPLHEVSRMAGIELPEYMGKVAETGEGASGAPKPRVGQAQPPANPAGGAGKG